MKTTSVLSLGAIAAVFVAGSAYLTFGVVKVDLLKEYTHASVTLPDSGNLLPRSPILFDGIKIGNVTAVNKTLGGVEVDFRVDEPYQIPVASSARVEQLSALGEPYIVFTSDSEAGPYLQDGEHLDPRMVSTPLSFPEMAKSVTELMDQLDPEPISNFIDTFSVALDGTENVVPQLSRSMNLLARTLIARQPQLASTLINLQVNAENMDWIGPSLSDAAPDWALLGEKISDAVYSVERISQVENFPDTYTTEDGLVPTIDRITAWIERAGPDIKKFEPVLRPLIQALTVVVNQVNISALISDALRVVERGAVRAQVNVR